MTPKPYISWTQLSTWEYSPEEYRQKYILGEWPPPNKYMEFGKRFAEIVEKGETPDDPRLQHVLEFLPAYPVREFKFGAPCKIDKKDVRLYCVFDGYYPQEHKIGEIKTGKNWSQKKADDHGQLTFYAYAYYLKFKKIPSLELIWVETEDVEDEIQATGNVQTFPTKRETKDLMAMHARIEAAWRGIRELYAQEFKSIT